MTEGSGIPSGRSLRHQRTGTGRAPARAFLRRRTCRLDREVGEPGVIVREARGEQQAVQVSNRGAEDWSPYLWNKGTDELVVKA
jgi:hypothetical protein